MGSLRGLCLLGLALGLLAPRCAAAGPSESEARFAAAALIRARLSRGEALPPALLSEAKHLQRERSGLMDRNDRAVVDAALALRLGGFSVPGPGMTAALPAAAPIPAAVLAEPDFPTFLKGVSAEAAKEGVPQSVLTEALTGLTVDQKVLA